MNPAAGGYVGTEELLPLMIGSAHGPSGDTLPQGGSAGAAMATVESVRLVLAGDPGMRPDGLERALIRAGFAVAEATLFTVGQVLPEAVLVTAFDEVDAAGALDVLRARLGGRIPVTLVLHRDAPGAVVRLLDGGAADVMTAPVDLAELVARLGARLRAHRAGVAARTETEQAGRLFDGFLEVAAATRPEELLHALVRQVGEALPGVECACILAGPEQADGRLVATSGNPRLRDVRVALDRYPGARDAVRSGTRATTAQGIGLPLLQQGRAIGALVLLAADGRRLGRELLDAIERLVAGAGRLLEAQSRIAAKLRQAAAGAVDPVTGCAGLDQLDHRLLEEFDRARRYGLRFSLVLLDVDGLDAINQRGGNEAGDRLLAAIGAVLGRELRASDFAARYGGDEFALILPETGADGARELVERVRVRLGEAHGEGAAPGLTAGVATVPHPSAVLPEDLFAMAETALREAKAGDGARVGVAA